MAIDSDTSERVLHGVDDFESIIAPKLEDLGRRIERLGRLRRVGQQRTEANLVEIRRALDEVRRLAEEIQGLESQVARDVLGFRMALVPEDQEEWSQRFRRALHSQYPPVEGEFPTFLVFPVEVRVDFARDAVYLNNRSVRTLHPEAVARRVEREIDRLNQERFHGLQFAKALLRAYDLLQAEARDSESGTKRGRAVKLRDVHQVLTLRSGASHYTLHQFAFDIYRLRREGVLRVDGRRLVFGSTRNRGGLVIVLPGGQREVLGSLEVVDDQ
ncbi:MAG: hypothetical protein OWU84_07670 [Firmicutes bacterium]|nr:hypothetical protein [Bacillota bacterium]